MNSEKAAMSENLNVQYGAGWHSAPDWLSFDSSPSLWLERIPFIGGMIRMNPEPFPATTRFGDITRGLPLADGSAKAVYASHVLEHLSYNACLVALRNSYRLLKPGGVFRLIVPDLAVRVDRYVAARDAGQPDASLRFLRETLLGREARVSSPLGYLRALIGNSDHLWMWDEASMKAALAGAGFVDIRRCDLGDSEDPAFAAVERANRFRDEQLNVRELGIEARRPAR